MLAVGGHVVAMQPRRQVVASDLDVRVANIGPVSSRRGLVAGNAIAGGIERCILAGELQPTAGHRTEVGLGWQEGFSRCTASCVPTDTNCVRRERGANVEK